MLIGRPKYFVIWKTVVQNLPRQKSVNWQTKVLVIWKVVQQNSPRQKSVNWQTKVLVIIYGR